MGGLSMKNVCEKAGKLYFRRQINGKDTYIPLPPLGSREFADAYEALSQADRPKSAAAPGTMAALVAKALKDSAAFKQGAPSTKANRRRYLDIIAAEPSKPTVAGDPKLGTRSVKGMRPFHLYAIRDAMADTPGTFNNYIAVMKMLMRYACEIDWRDNNPAADIPQLEIGEHEPWPAELLAVCLDVATDMTRLALVTALCSGQRISDSIRMQHSWHDRSIMELQHKKTKVVVAIPMHPIWLEEIDKFPRRSTTLLYDRFGRPFQSTGTLQSRIRDLMDHPKVVKVLDELRASGRIAPDARFSLHGLRKNACCYLLELGISDTEVGAILGMSPEMVRHYGKRARALMIARGAAERIKAGKIVPIRPGKVSTGNGKT